MAAALRSSTARGLLFRTLCPRIINPLSRTSFQLTACLYTATASAPPSSHPPPPPPPPPIANSKLGAEEYKYFGDNGDSSSSSSSSSNSSSDADNGSALATRILDAALGHVPSLGWTSAALAAAAVGMGLSAQSAGKAHLPLSCPHYCVDSVAWQVSLVLRTVSCFTRTRSHTPRSRPPPHHHPCI
jgi:hypothetical protein